MSELYHLTTDEIHAEVFRLGHQIDVGIEKMRALERRGKLAKAEQIFHQLRAPISRRNLLRDELDARHRAGTAAPQQAPTPKQTRPLRVLCGG
jgi:hypothetical protein